MWRGGGDRDGVAQRGSKNICFKIRPTKTHKRGSRRQSRQNTKTRLDAESQHTLYPVLPTAPALGAYIHSADRSSYTPLPLPNTCLRHVKGARYPHHPHMPPARSSRMPRRHSDATHPTPPPALPLPTSTKCAPTGHHPHPPHPPPGAARRPHPLLPCSIMCRASSVLERPSRAATEAATEQGS